MNDPRQLPAITEMPTAEEASGATAWVQPPGDLVQGPLNRALVRLAGPAILAKTLHALLALVDVFWVGRLGAAPTAAVTTSFFASWILLSATDLTALGILAHVARNVGAGDRRRAGFAAGQGLLLGIFLGLVLAVGAWFGAPALFRALGAEAAVVQGRSIFLRIFFLAAPLTFTYINCEFLMRAAGNTRTPMLITGAMVLFNAILDPFLIYGIGPFPRLEVMGAAIATFLAQIVAVAAFAWRAAVRDPSFPFERSGMRRIEPALARSLLAIGFPGMAVGVLFSVIYLFMSGIVARLGTPELAILGLANRAESLTFLTTTGFAAATAALVGQNLGARRPDRAERAAWLSATWMGLYGLVVGAVLVVWPRQILAIFTSDAQVLAQGPAYLRILGYAQPLMALEIVFENAFSGAGDTVPPMIISVPTNVLRIPLIWWVVYDLHAGLIGIGWVLAITCMVRGILAALWFRRGAWKRRQL